MCESILLKPWIEQKKIAFCKIILFWDAKLHPGLPQRKAGAKSFFRHLWRFAITLLCVLRCASSISFFSLMWNQSSYRHVSALDKLESTASASQERTINSKGEKLNEAEENTLLLKHHHYFARRGVLGWGGSALFQIVYLADSEKGTTRVRIDFSFSIRKCNLLSLVTNISVLCFAILVGPAWLSEV